ncbi:HK97-gp10 family putative phage morphogenesis protein [Paracoccus alkanivorans]|uniref:HK97 gp10 family phage protein n=1 Tax=Paracoccus alkanivorans TaxID=2116655 RepID=A0A3M0ME33_9RHOB|nr:HK97-gp10 family putative phage morphogenesis protein [Paracoccus alkanivorans]RMC35363.1 HK97 gp10 family phage protein [Paracoccus alkanivorans]
MADDGGLSSFQKRMNAIPREVRKAVEPALMKSAYEIQDRMEQLAPEDTGDLVGSIAVTGPGQATPPYSQPGGSTVVPENAAMITVGNTDVRYAHLVEYGTIKSAAVPFFWPGFRLGRKRATNLIKRAIGKAIKEAR